MAGKILRLTGVLEAVGVKKSSIYNWVRDGKFPAPVRLGPRSVGWRQEDVEKWLASLESARGDSAC
ncbi:helix-turn-helix transcriptional regulator [Paraburkholderia hospita]